MQRILVLRGGAVGDLIVTLPAVRALREAFPGVPLELVGHAPRAILAHHPLYAEHVVDMERWELYRLFQDRPTVPAAMAAFLGRFTCVLSYIPAPDETFVRNLQRYCAGPVHTWHPHPPAEVHITTHLLQPVLQLAPHPYDACPQVYLAPEAMQAAAHFWDSAGLPAHGVIAWHLGSGGRHKLWPEAGWQHLVHWAARHGLPGLYIRGPAEHALGPAFPPWPCADHVPLPVLAAILARCQVVVGHDSGVSHLAAAVGTRTVTLFGPTDPLVWGPRSPLAYVLRPETLGPLTIDNLPPAAVIQALQAVYAGHALGPASPVGCTIVTPRTLLDDPLLA